MAKELDIYDDDDDGMMDNMIMMMFMVIMIVAVVRIVPGIVQATTAAQGTLALGLDEPHSVTAKTTIQEVKFPQPMQSVSVQNDGGTTAYIKINALDSNPNVLNAGEGLELDYNTHVIERVFYYTLSGQTALRIIGTG